jgi:uridine kinase
MEKKPILIGLIGATGSGKTTFINTIRKRYALEKVCIISQDEYYKPIYEQEKDVNGIENFDVAKSVDKKLLLNDLKKLLNNEEVIKAEYTFNNIEIKPKIITFKPAPIIIVEGLFVMHYKKIRELMDLKIYVHASDHLNIIRRIKRDQVERGYPIDDVLYRYENHVMPGFRKYIEPYRDEADIVINNNKGFEKSLDIFCAYLDSQI